MRRITESYTVATNEDGSRTTTEVTTEYPASMRPATALLAVELLLAAGIAVSIAYPSVYNRARRKIEARKTAKLTK